MTLFGKHALTRRSLLKAGAASGAALAIPTGMGGCAKRPSKLAIVHTNDTHGYDLLNDESLGLAAAVALKHDYEEKGYEVLLLDAGDAVQGENLVNHSMGDSAMDFLNLCGYHAMCLGNHEFDFGQDKVFDYVARADFPVLSANIIVDATGETLVEQRIIHTLADGTKVGIFGLTTPETYTKTNPLVVRGLTFLQGEELYACAQQQADALREAGCSLVICLAHLGELDESAPNRACDVAAATTGIDLIVDGHDHFEENQLVGNAAGEDVLIVETGCHTHAIGTVMWEDGTLSCSLEAFGSYGGQDEEVAAYIQAVSDDVNADLADVVATSDFPLDGERSPGVRTRETNLGDLLADAILWETQKMADDYPHCAIVNGGSIRSSIHPGEITAGNILNAQPFINYACTVQIEGAKLLEALEAACHVTPEEAGAFPQVSGITLTVNTHTPFESAGTYPGSTFEIPAKPGSRVTIHDVGGSAFDPEETYTIASTDFVCAGGDAYFAFAEAATTTMRTIGYLTSECLRYYLQEACNGVVPEDYADPLGQGRVEIIA